MNKYVIYTILVGGYDEVRQPAAVDGRFDYVLFSDKNVGETIGMWQVRAVPYEAADFYHLSRYAKCHPTLLLPDYEASLYIDANICILTPWVYERFVELVDKKTEWAGINHPEQHCSYDEICAIVQLRWVYDNEVVRWYSFLRNACFPEGYGLYENNVIFRRHTSIAEEIGLHWWRTLTTECKRDQFSLMYLLWKYKPVMASFLPAEECPRLGSPNFAYFPHNPHTRVRKLGFHQMMRFRVIRTKYPNDICKGYKEMFDWASCFKHPHFALLLWEVLLGIRYAPKIIRNSIHNRIR